jgi:hypothetical protein
MTTITATPSAFRAGAYTVGWTNGAHTILLVTANVTSILFYGAFHTITGSVTAQPWSLQWGQ